MKLGHPDPESYFVADENNGSPHTTQAYVPDRFSFQYFPEKAGSVPASWVTWYCSDVSLLCKSDVSFGSLMSKEYPCNTGSATRDPWYSFAGRHILPCEKIICGLNDGGVHILELHPEFVLSLRRVERERSPEVRFDE